jgi:hypothetical protein
MRAAGEDPDGTMQMTTPEKPGAADPPPLAARGPAPHGPPFFLLLSAVVFLAAHLYAGEALAAGAVRSPFAISPEAELVCREPPLAAPTGWDFDPLSCRTRVSRNAMELPVPRPRVERALAAEAPSRSTILTNGDTSMRNPSSTNMKNEASRCWLVARGMDLAAIFICFFFFWPAALALLVWKLLGYPGADETKAFLERELGRLFERLGFRRPQSPARNLAFEDYRRREIERLEAERAALDEDARAFDAFVEELKRAKDHEEFAAFMARRAQPAGA